MKGPKDMRGIVHLGEIVDVLQEHAPEVAQGLGARDLGELFAALEQDPGLEGWVIQGADGDEPDRLMGHDVVRLVEHYLQCGGGVTDTTANSEALKQLARERGWKLELKDGRMVYDAPKIHALADLLAQPQVLEVIDEVVAALPCPTCDARRQFSVGFGRVFIDECVPCTRAASVELLEGWRAELVDAWRSGPRVELREVHWSTPGVTYDPRLEHLLTEGDDERWGAYIFGASGTGKTQQSVEFVRQVFARRAALFGLGDAERYAWQVVDQREVVYLTESALLASLRPGGGATREEYERVPLLIIDDLGTASATPWAAEQMGALIDARYGMRRRTLVTSNYSLKDLLSSSSNAYDQRIIRRLYDMCGGAQARGRGRLAIWRMDTNYSLPEGW